MPVGFEAINTSNVVQIDENYRNMVLLKSGQFTANDTTTAQDLWWINNQDVWTKTTANAIIAIRCPYPGVVMGPGSYRSGLKVCNFLYPTGDSVTIQYYIFDLVPPTNSDHVGMQIFDASGNLIYSAYDYPLRVIGYENTEFPTFPGNDYTYALSNGDFAVVGLGGGYTLDIDGIDAETSLVRTYSRGNLFYSYPVQYVNDAPGEAAEQIGTEYPAYLFVDTSNVPLNYLRS